MHPHDLDKSWASYFFLRRKSKPTNQPNKKVKEEGRIVKREGKGEENYKVEKPEVGVILQCMTRKKNKTKQKEKERKKKKKQKLLK